MGIIWTIIIGFVAGVIAKLIHPGSNEPAGFILTTLLGIAGAFVATYLGTALGFYRPGEGAGLIGAVVGALIVLLILGAVRSPGHPTSMSGRPRRVPSAFLRFGLSFALCLAPRLIAFVAFTFLDNRLAFLRRSAASERLSSSLSENQAKEVGPQ